jgi:hypothetical protein
LLVQRQLPEPNAAVELTTLGELVAGMWLLAALMSALASAAVSAAPSPAPFRR